MGESRRRIHSEMLCATSAVMCNRKRPARSNERAGRLYIQEKLALGDRCRERTSYFRAETTCLLLQTRVSNQASKTARSSHGAMTITPYAINPTER